MLIQKPTWPVELFLKNMFLWRTHTLKFIGGFPNHLSRLRHGWNVKCPPLVHALMSYNQINQSENNMCYVYIYIQLQTDTGHCSWNQCNKPTGTHYRWYIYATIQIKFFDLLSEFLLVYHISWSRFQAPPHGRQATTPLERRSLIWCWTAFANSQTTAPVSWMWFNGDLMDFNGDLINWDLMMIYWWFNGV